MSSPSSADAHPKPNPGSDGRSRTLDVLRGVAAILMVEQHLGIWLLDARTYFTSLNRLHLGLNLLGGLAAPLFVFAAGASAFSARARGQTLATRGLKLIALGYLLNLLTPSWFSPVSFYILHLLGAWLVFSPLWLRLPVFALPWAAAASFGLGAAGQVLLRVPRTVKNDWMNELRAPGGILRLAFIEGHFPLFPWLGLALLGAFAFAARTDKRGQRAAFGLGAFGLTLSLVLSLSGELKPRWAHVLPTRPIFSFSFYPATLPFCLLVGSVCLLAFLALDRLFRPGISRSPEAPDISSPNLGARGPLWSVMTSTEWLDRLGQTSLTLLFVHIVLFRELLGRMGLDHRLNPSLALAVVVVTLMAWALGTRAWKRHNYRFGFEWLLRRGESPRRPAA
jgi:uncharacterized membrane protein